YDYRLNYFEDVRFGYTFDSFLKLFYIALAIASLFILQGKFAKNAEDYVRTFLTGAVIACIFSWYLFFASFLHYTPHFFNNSPDARQTFFIPLVGEFYRIVMFKEGNHMALFLFVCVFCAHRLRS